MPKKPRRWATLASVWMTKVAMDLKLQSRIMTSLENPKTVYLTRMDSELGKQKLAACLYTNKHNEVCTYFAFVHQGY